MIQAKDLRIGNWALYPHTVKEPFKITEPRHIELAYLLEPIPLTPEILQKCGFEVNFSFAKKDFIRIEFKPINLGYDDFEMEYIIGFGKSKKLKYLHQLQNLYYYLTGEELSIQL